ncbi:MAG TPA: hypothetical protein VHB70_19755 [Parafilimonas sp.]|nr:hypothetical protein [Parafilimonas sp.]
MKKVIIATIVAGAAALTYIIIRKKFATQNEIPEVKTKAPQLKHHLTSVFTNAKKHAMHTN